MKKKKKKAAPSEPRADPEPAPVAEPEESTTSTSKAEPETPAPEDSKDAPPPEEDSAVVDTPEDHPPVSPQSQSASLAQQSKLRSASFRQGSISAGSGPLSPGSFSPEGETATDIYKKHVARIDELEKENKRLAKEAADAEKRWKKAEEELADLREEDGQGNDGKTGSDSVVENLVGC